MIVISFSFFCQMIFSECCDPFEIRIWMFSSAIWQSGESWPSVARSNASTSIWQWHLEKVFILIHPRRKYVHISKTEKKGIFICVLIICFVLFLVNILRDMLAKVLLWFFFFFLFFWMMYSIWYNIYTNFMWLSFCVPLRFLFSNWQANQCV